MIYDNMTAFGGELIFLLQNSGLKPICVTQLENNRIFVSIFSPKSLPHHEEQFCFKIWYDKIIKDYEILLRGVCEPIAHLACCCVIF